MRRFRASSIVVALCSLVELDACSESNENSSAVGGEGTYGATQGDSGFPATSGVLTSDGRPDPSGGSASIGGSTSGRTTETSGGTLDSGTSSGSSSSGAPDWPPEPGIYVHPDGAGSNPGTAAAPLRTIQGGLATAATRGLGAVYVAGGAYAASSDAGETVVVVSGVDLIGGFDPTDWGVRDPSVHVTTIYDPSTSGEILPVAVDISDVTDSTVDGLRIEASILPNSMAVVVRAGDPIIQDSAIMGEVRLTDSTSATIQTTRLEHSHVAIRCLASGGPPPTPTVRRNLIAGTVVWSCGGTLASSVVRENSEGIPSNGRGMVTVEGAATATIVSNTIVLNSVLAPPNSAVLVYGSAPGSHTVVDNNIIAPGGACISQEGSDFGGGDPFVLGSLRHNNLACNVLHQRFLIVTNGSPWTTDGEITTLAGVHAEVGGAIGNVSQDPGVIDIASDWHLRTDGTTPCGVSRGGEDASAAHANPDFDAVDRTVPWSIGAFEYDGTCL